MSSRFGSVSQYVAYTFYRVDPAWRRLPVEERVAGVKAMLAGPRAHVTVYHGDLDATGHLVGWGSPQWLDQRQLVDDAPFVWLFVGNDYVAYRNTTKGFLHIPTGKRVTACVAVLRGVGHLADSHTVEDDPDNAPKAHSASLMRSVN